MKQLKTPRGDLLYCTDIERTLIDIVVRPAYSGGLPAVCAAYKKAVHKADIDYMVSLLRKMKNVYPYHQSIGFLFEQAGLSEGVLKKFHKFGTDFDFFLDYDLRRPVYDAKWKLYYPRSLKQ